MPSLASSSVVGTLTYLREQTFPKLIDPPRFVPRTRSFPAQPDWLSGTLQRVGRRALGAALFAATAVLIATSLPAWGSLLSGSAAAPPSPAVRSSAGETASYTSRVDDFGAHDFLAGNPFVVRSRLLSRGDDSPHAFLAGGLQENIAEYVNGLAYHAAGPYQAAALETQQALDEWYAAVIDEVARQQEAAAPVPPEFAFSAPATSAIWESNYAPGTLIPGVTVTFYACLGNGFCGNMASGQQVFPGAAACSMDMAFGTRFVVVNDPSQIVFTCLDRGALASPWVDVWFYSVEQGQAWQRNVGMISDIRIVE
jgi:hypothetical protein